MKNSAITLSVLGLALLAGTANAAVWGQVARAGGRTVSLG